MSKKKINISEEVIDTAQFLPGEKLEDSVENTDISEETKKTTRKRKVVQENIALPDEISESANPAKLSSEEVQEEAATPARKRKSPSDAVQMSFDIEAEKPVKKVVKKPTKSTGTAAKSTAPKAPRKKKPAPIRADELEEMDVKSGDEILSLQQKKVQNKRKRRTITGAIMFVLMVIGVGSIISMGIGFANDLLDNTAEKERYNSLLATLVVADPLPFESPDLADQRLLIASSIWAAVINEDMEQYEKNDFAQTYLPAVEVDKYFTKVFGSQYKLQHQSFSDQEVEFEFDEEKQAYIIPITSFPTGFTPKVEKIKTSRNEKIVTVGYISPATSWSDTSDGSISKYVDYIFQKQGQNFYLVAIRESEMKVAKASPAKSAK